MTLLAAGGLSGAVWASASMMVTDLQGRVQLGKGEALTLLYPVGPGSELRLGQASSLVLTDLGTGREFVLRGPGHFIVGAGNVRSGEGEGAVEARQLAVAALPPVRASTRIAVAAVRMRTGSPASCSEVLDSRALQLAPNMTALSPPVPALRWPEVPGVRSYRISLIDDAAQTLASATIDSTTWEPHPRITWDEGRNYTWRVQAVRDGVPGGAEVIAQFSILPKATARMLQDLEPPEGAPLSHRVLYAAQLQEAGDIRTACQEWRRIHELRPDDVGVQRLLR